jgi:hypothetical protein
MNGRKGVINPFYVMAIALAIVLMFFMGMKIATVFLGKFPVVQANNIASSVDTIYAAPENIEYEINLEDPTSGFYYLGWIFWSDALVYSEKGCFSKIDINILQGLLGEVGTILSLLESIEDAEEDKITIKGIEISITCIPFHEDLSTDSPISYAEQDELSLVKTYDPITKKNRIRWPE